MQEENQVLIFKSSKVTNEFKVILDVNSDTIWATEKQIGELFGKARRTIGEHISNIYTEKELDKISTWRKSRQVEIEGKRKVNRETSFYNLDVIISVGYRVKSPIATEFRKWATKKLKDYLIEGYTLNEELLIKQNRKVKQLEEQVDHLNDKLVRSQENLTDRFLSIIATYSKSFELLNKFDSNNLSLSNLNKEIIYVINF